ncbi:MAG: RNA polymerase sigma factor [Pirellulales bacterium]|nr:RNA polymerase sigma factor [Pirellulales bacterium]
MTLPSPALGQQERFAEWDREHGPAVRGYLLAMTRRPDVADDLAQDVFCRAWEARERYREQGSFRAYLLRIADRLLVDRSRRARREVTLDPEDWQYVEPASGARGPARAAAHGEQVRRLNDALQALSPVQQRVLLLRYYGQLRFAEIAEAIGCPLGTVLSHCHRGLGALRARLVEDAG